MSAWRLPPACLVHAQGDSPSSAPTPRVRALPLALPRAARGAQGHAIARARPRRLATSRFLPTVGRPSSRQALSHPLLPRAARLPRAAPAQPRHSRNSVAAGALRTARRAHRQPGAARHALPAAVRGGLVHSNHEGLAWHVEPRHRDGARAVCQPPRRAVPARAVGERVERLERSALVLPIARRGGGARLAGADAQRCRSDDLGQQPQPQPQPAGAAAAPSAGHRAKSRRRGDGAARRSRRGRHVVMWRSRLPRRLLCRLRGRRGPMAGSGPCRSSPGTADGLRALGAQHGAAQRRPRMGEAVRRAVAAGAARAITSLCRGAGYVRRGRGAGAGAVRRLGG
eukprot:293533-Chlamydomonas_euryale.AAC.5